nr:YbjQ family protein [Anoxybacter fermentans]
MRMLIVSTESIPGKKIVKTLGLVRGSTIRARHIGSDVLAGLRNLVGGEVKQYTRMLIESREQAINRMVADAKELGANAVVGVRFTTSQVMSGAAEILAYGTAVIVEDEE